MSTRTRQALTIVAFALFGGLWSIQGAHQGPAGIALGALAGAALAVALYLFAADVRDRARRGNG